MCALAVATTAGNAAVLVALKRARPRAPAHAPLASLAVADLLLGVTVLPMAAARECFTFPIDRFWCACWSTLDVLCCTASILSLCALGWERFSGVTSPLNIARRTKLSRLHAWLVWPVALLIAIPTTLVPTRHDDKPCTVNTNVGYVFYSITLSFYLPAGVMVILYSRILRVLGSPPPVRAHRGSPRSKKPPGNSIETPVKTIEILSQNSGGQEETKSAFQKLKLFLSPNKIHLGLPNATSGTNTTSPGSKTNEPGALDVTSRQRRATRTILLLMALFLVCWTPFFVMLPIDSVCDCVSETAWRWCTWLGYANSALDPLVYAVASPTVRRALHSTLSLSRSDPPSTPIPTYSHTRSPKKLNIEMTCTNLDFVDSNVNVCD